MYVVTCESVYRHEIVGLYTNIEKAKEEAVKVANSQKDSHHYFEIYWMPVNETYRGSIGEGESSNQEQLLLTLKRVDTSHSFDLMWVRRDFRTQMLPEELAISMPYADPMDEYSYKLLEKDPQAVDMWKDIVTSSR